MSDTHEANVVRVGPILPHPNADKLELTMVGGYQVVTGKGNFKEGDLAVYIQPDSVVPQTWPFKFIWEQHATLVDPKTVAEFVLMPHASNEDVSKVWTVAPAKRRRITVKRLRKEYSEGLLMPISDFSDELGSNAAPDAFSFTNDIGPDVAKLIGVTRYVPEFDAESTKADTAAVPRRRRPKTLKGWFYFLLRKLGIRNAGGQSYAQEVSFVLPEYDINAFKNAKRETFREGELVTVTEKIHGSNARYTFISEEKRPNPLNPNGKLYVGSHRQWKLDGGNGNVWWNATRQHPAIEEFAVSHPGKVLYGEVGPTQKGYRYGAGDGETFFFAFDVFDPETKTWEWPGNYGVTGTVPILYSGPYDSDVIKGLVDGPSVVPGAKTQREGIVISSRERRLKLKIVSNAFLEKDSK